MLPSGKILSPGATIGILGGGQLGRMSAMAAAQLGYDCHIFCPDEASPAAKVSARWTKADYRDQAALKKFADQVDLVTFEFENIPSETVEFLSHLDKLVHPSPRILAIAQDRFLEKTFLNRSQIATAPFALVRDQIDLTSAVSAIGCPAILKTTTMGYDGKGQFKINHPDDNSAAMAMLGNRVGILEGYVDFEMEISVIIARNNAGRIALYPPVENRHVNHILDTTIVPARIDQVIIDKAEGMAHHIAQELELVGLLAVEMFVTPAGDVLVNELAPRPHNSGHWTIDACVTSQFEQFIRAICGLPLGSTERFGDAVMKNLIGDEVHQWPQILEDASAKLHLYGKSEAKPGRKMGHVTRTLRS